jgi:hypothetical protein
MWIVPDNPAAKDPFWDTSARMILESILIHLWNNNEFTNSAIRRMIKLPPEELSEELAGLDGAEFASKKDSLAVLKTKMQWVDFLGDGSFSLRDWINSDKRGLIFYQIPKKLRRYFVHF